MFVRESIQRFAIGVACVNSEIDHVPQSLRLADDLLHEPPDTMRRMHLPLPQDRMQKAVAQSVAVSRAVVRAGHRVASHQRMIHGLLVITVVRGTGLLAIHLNGKAVDVHGYAPRRRPLRGARAAGGPQMPLARIGEHIAQRRPVAGSERQDIDQPRLRRLAGEPFLDGLVAGAVPSGHLHRGIMRQAVGVVLGGVAEGESIHAFAKEFDELIASDVLLARIFEAGGQRLGEPEAMIGFSEEDETTVGGDPVIAGEHLDGAVERGFPKGLFSFTHCVISWCDVECCLHLMKHWESRNDSFIPNMLRE